MLSMDAKQQVNNFLENLLHSLQSRFGYPQFDDPQAALFKLNQSTTVIGYQTEFESLSNRIVGLPSNALVSCFISSLKPHIMREVQALQLINLT